MAINPEKIGKRIKGERRRLGYTQDQFSEILSTGRVHLANIEAGRKMASLDLLVSICEILDCSLDYIVFGTTNSNATLKARISHAISILQSAYDDLDCLSYQITYVILARSEHGCNVRAQNELSLNDYIKFYIFNDK